MVAFDRYLARIGYGGATERTPEVLAALARHHVEAIPFENLDVLLDRGVSLSPEAVDAKLLGGRGGYCFEQNGLFLRVLRELGFHAEPVSARVRIDRPRSEVPPRTHMFVEVSLGGTPWLADVGVGALSVTGALRLDTEARQPTAHEPRRVVFEQGRRFHQVERDGAWEDVCEFTGERMPAIDQELANWFTSAHPASHFKNRLLVARALPDGGRVTLLNRRLTVRRGAQVLEQRELGTPDELLQVLAERFSLAFPAGTRFRCPALDFPSEAP